MQKGSSGFSWGKGVVIVALIVIVIVLLFYIFKPVSRFDPGGSGVVDCVAQGKSTCTVGTTSCCYNPSEQFCDSSSSPPCRDKCGFGIYSGFGKTCYGVGSSSNVTECCASSENCGLKAVGAFAYPICLPANCSEVTH
ncbi:MAG: hypothetical protein AABX66_02945 [Nanoarchaeota archaeon]